jgi:hypothetical protein
VRCFAKSEQARRRLGTWHAKQYPEAVWLEEIQKLRFFAPFNARVRPHRRLGVRFGTLLEENTMTQLLEKALSQVAKLPASEQDAVAAIVMEELASEQRWTDSFAKSQDLLAKLAEKALADHAAGRTKPL